MSGSLPLVTCDDVTPGTCTEVVAEGRIYAVFNVEGQFFVLDGICPHAGGPLGKGTMQGSVVTCPWHGWQFDVRSGQHQLSDTICQEGFRVFLVDGMICIDAPDP